MNESVFTTYKRIIACSQALFATTAVFSCYVPFRNFNRVSVIISSRRIISEHIFTLFYKHVTFLKYLKACYTGSLLNNWSTSAKAPFFFERQSAREMCSNFNFLHIDIILSLIEAFAKTDFNGYVKYLFWLLGDEGLQIVLVALVG